MLRNISYISCIYLKVNILYYSFLTIVFYNNISNDFVGALVLVLVNFASVDIILYIFHVDILF